MQWAKQQKGFTIVELLIVVVVIAILAVITIVAYNGITQRAKDSIAKNSIASAQKKLATWFIENNEMFPSDLSSTGLVDSGGISYQYTVNNSTTPKGYCVTVVANNVAYRLGKDFAYNAGANSINEGSPSSGACPGHSTNMQNPVITNLVSNPSAEVSSSGYLGPNSTVITQSSTRAQSGSSSVLGIMPAGHAGSNVGVGIFRTTSHAAAGLKPSTTYTVSVSVYVPAGTVGAEISVQGNGRTAAVNPPERVTALKDQWVRLWNTFTTTATDGQVTIYVLNRETTPASPAQQIWIDSVMLVEGTQPYTYADGSSTGWVWNGTPGLSASSGPAL